MTKINSYNYNFWGRTSEEKEDGICQPGLPAPTALENRHEETLFIMHMHHFDRHDSNMHHKRQMISCFLFYYLVSKKRDTHNY